MSSLTRSQALWMWIWHSRLNWAAWTGQLSGKIMGVTDRVATVHHALDERDGQRSFEEQLQQMGRVRYR